MTVTANLTMGPVLFHWPEQQKRDFWFRIADEAPVDVAYLGEVVCSKRTPFFDHSLEAVAERLQRGGKRVVWSTLAEVVNKLDRKVIESFCGFDEVEANDVSALHYLTGRPHRIGQYLNIYNEETVRHLSNNGATHFCLPVELPMPAVAELAKAAGETGAGVEVQVFGKVSLALSARCYHARAHNRTKDNCQFVCEKDPDGMDLKTHSGKPFLSVNGIQTLSEKYLTLSSELPALEEAGVTAFRLSPHSCDMVQVASAYRQLLDGEISASELDDILDQAGIPAQRMNGFVHGKPGFQYVANQS
ncbi:ubiquinone anaerobic biosynthesis protein UbiV [Hoeflea sp.]|uniref:ubiquinone anaerobic biosynthesis protein UbiV n=1 Tax=Hoeflea sp. TaxID=1940281 RepID=UPI003A9466F0